MQVSVVRDVKLTNEFLSIFELIVLDAVAQRLSRVDATRQEYAEKRKRDWEPINVPPSIR